MDGLRHLVRGEFVAELCESRRKLAQTADLHRLKGKITPEEVVEARR
ncbi:MAG: hypothetical protein M3327_09400 [Actinomycetota bacterium]|nr:hypothetical protein [Actinomycetota bacterium]